MQHTHTQTYRDSNSNPDFKPNLEHNIPQSQNVPSSIAIHKTHAYKTLQSQTLKINDNAGGLVEKIRGRNATDTHSFITV